MTRKRRASTTAYANGLLLLVTGVGVGWLIGLSLSPVLHVIVGSVIALVAGVVGSLAGLHDEPKDDDEEETGAGRRPSRLRQNVAHINPLPLAMLMVGTAVGSSLGIYARTNDLFGPDPQKFARKWAGTGLGEQALQGRLFNSLYPQGASEVGPKPEPEPSVKSDAPAEDVTPDAAVRGETAATPQAPRLTAAAKVKTPRPPPAPPASGGGLDARQFAAGLYSVSAEDCQLLTGKSGKELRTRLLALDRPKITEAARGCQDADDACLAAIKEKICPRR